MEPHQLEEVARWFEAGEQADYLAGVLLLQEHSGNRSLVNNLLKKESAINREKLTYELVKCCCGGQMEHVSEVMSHFAQAVQAAVVPEQVPAPLPMAAPDTEHLPEAVQAEVDEITQLMQKLYNQRCQLSNSLADIDPAEAPRVTSEILSLQNQYNALSEKRERLVAGEALPAVEETPAADTTPAAEQPDRAALIQQRGNLRSQVSKAKKAVEKSPNDQLKAEKLAKLVVELTALELQIKALDA